MIDALIARIKNTVPDIKFVGGAAEFQTAADNAPKVTPAVFVIQLEETPSPSADANIVIQRVHAVVGIILVVRNVSDNTGAAALASTEALRKAIKDQVFGWQAKPELDPFERAGSHLLAFRDGHAWWQDAYSTIYYDRSKL